MSIYMSLVSTDQVIQITSILASGAFIGLQIRSAKKREIEFKIHQQRKEQYTKLINLFIDIFKTAKNSNGNFDPKNLNFNQDDWFNIQIGMSMYASEDVLKAYINLMKTSRENPVMSIRKLGDLLLMMRKEVGFDDSNLSSRQILSTFINDIHFSKYDEYFE
jgi:hypothetical protein